MLKVRVIPCLDVKDGRVVKGVQFVSLRDAGDPVEQARAYDAAGADELMFLDITASHEGRDAIFDVIARTADVCFMPVVGRRRHPQRRGPRARAAARRRRQGLDQHRRGRGPRPDQPLRRRLRLAGGGGGHRRQARPARAAAAATTAGRCSPTAAARPTGLDVVDYARRGGRARRRRDPADLDGPRRRQDRLRHRPADGRLVGGRRAGDRQRRRRQRASTWSTR